MLKMNREKILSAPVVFALYILASWISIQGFFLIFPGEAAPLAFFSTKWRFLRGLSGFLSLFPALSLSALVIPFGVNITPEEKLNVFSPKFLESLRGSVFTAIAAAGIYAVISLLFLPAARDYETLLRFQGRLYRMAALEARERAGLGDWEEAAAFVDICERIWPEGPDIENVRIETNIRMEAARLAVTPPEETAAASRVWPNLPDQAPPDAAGALALAETALTEERYFDAHWLASLGGRLAGPGSAETAAASILASRAWKAINSLEPNSRENEAVRVYRLKRDGYEALINEDWIRAYYIFLELKTISPNDPDAEKYFKLSEEGCAGVAFFIDEMDTALGNIYTDSVFSLPVDSGRAVLRLSSLTVFPDSAYAADMEILVFDRNNRPAWRMKAPRVKFLPLVMENGSRVNLLCRALDRDNADRSLEPVAEGLGEAAPSIARITLNAGWDDFLLLTNLRRGTSGLPVNELLETAKISGNYGYMPQVFEAEVLCRFAHPLLFLASAVAALAAGWRYRAQKRPRYLFLPMMIMLPLVFNGFVHFGRTWINYAGIWAVISFGFNAALVIFGVSAAVLLVVSLILLAAQHG